MPSLNNIRRLFRVAGPWPIEAKYLGALTFFLVASLYSLEAHGHQAIFSGGVLLRPLLSLAVALLAWMQLSFLNKSIPRCANNSLCYFLVLGIHSFLVWSWIVLFRNLIPEIKAGTAAFASPVPVIRFYFTYACMNALIGHSRRQLSIALEEKGETLKLVESQRTLLLDYDETMRKRLSEFLHDRVQSSLVTACFELQSIQKNLEGNQRDEVSRVIQKLETLRAVDVRNASQTLTPPVGNADLATSISVMADQYAPHIKVKLIEDPALETLAEESSSEVSLGIYRIIEQALLNATIHGKATEIDVRICRSGSNYLLDIKNDGAPLLDVQKPGLGTAIINAWVRSLKGEWSITNSDTSHVTLTAILPVI